MLPGLWSLFAWKYYSIIQTVTWCQKLFSISRLPKKERKKKKKITQYLQCLATKTFDILGRETDAFFWLQNSNMIYSDDFLTGMLLSTTFMKTFGVILKAYTVSPSALHSGETLLNGNCVPLSTGLFPLQKEVFLKKVENVFHRCSIIPLKPAQISLIQNSELHFAAASLHSYALFILGSGVREET